MTDLIPNYETSGPLTKCPCCGDKDGPHGPRVCRGCWDRFSEREDAKLARSTPDESFARAEWARIGLELRRVGKLPPLREGRSLDSEAPAQEATRWGVWCGIADDWMVPYVGGPHIVGNKQAMTEKCQQNNDLFPGGRYTVRPYPDAGAKETSEAGSGAAREPAHDPGTTSSRAEAPKSVALSPKPDPYTANRLSRERRHVELTAERTRLEARLAEVVAELAVTEGEKKNG